MRGEKVALRAVEPGDIETLYLLENEPDILREGASALPVSRFTLEQYVMDVEKDIYKYRQLRFMIDALDKSTPLSVGAADLFDFDPLHRRAGVGIAVMKEYRRQGYALGALWLLCDYGFSVLGLHQLYCSVAEQNTASFDLFQKAGFEISGFRNDWLFRDEKWQKEILLQNIKK